MRSVAVAAARDCAGFTVIEVLVATLILVVGLIGTLGAFDAARTLNSSAEAHQSAEAVADRELQRIEAQPWSSIALQSAPTRPAGVTATSPLYYLQSSSVMCPGEGPTGASYNCYQWSWSNSSSSLYEPLVVGGSDATPDPWTWTSYDAGGGVQLSFSVFRFITWVNDADCAWSTCGASNGDYKRIVVAVTGTDLDEPVTLTTLDANPVYGSADVLDQPGVSCTDGSKSVSCVDQH